MDFNTFNANSKPRNTSSRPKKINMTPGHVTQHSIIPDVLRSVPGKLCMVRFGGGIMAEQGNKLTPKEVKDQPSVSWEGDADHFYTLVLVDPDVPSRREPYQREWLHWLVVNIPGCNVASGDVLAGFISSDPPHGTGQHRYVLMVYEQAGPQVFDERPLSATSAEGRGGFKIRAFAKKHKLGKAIAGNFYVSEYDEGVPQVF